MEPTFDMTFFDHCATCNEIIRSDNDRKTWHHDERRIRDHRAKAPELTDEDVAEIMRDAIADAREAMQ